MSVPRTHHYQPLRLHLFNLGASPILSLDIRRKTTIADICFLYSKRAINARTSKYCPLSFLSLEVNNSKGKSKGRTETCRISSQLKQEVGKERFAGKGDKASGINW